MKELLLLLCRYPFDKKNREKLSNLLGEVKNWHALVKLINDHGIIALAAYNIKESGLGNKIPAEAMAILENGYLQSIVRNTWLTEQWREVNTILNNAGIKHVLLKGMALEHTLYDSKGLRQMTDNDILIKREEALRAWHLLLQKGFSHEPVKSSLYIKILTDTGKHLPTLYKNGYAVEIHHKLWNTETGEGKNYTDPVDSSEEIQIGGIKAWILSEEIRMKHLNSHFEKHAREGNCQLRMYTDILLLDKSCTLTMPDKFIMNPKQEMTTEQRRIAYRENMRFVPLKYRLRYILGDIFPSIQWMKKRYNCSAVKALIYYPARIGKLIWLL
jgi:hypothetical protein